MKVGDSCLSGQLHPVPGMARTVTSCGWVMPFCHCLSGAAAGGVSALTLLCRMGATFLGSRPCCILPPTWPWSQAECPCPAGSSPCCDSPETPSWTRLFFLLLVILFFCSPLSQLPTPLLAVTHCLSFAETAVTAANTAPAPDECSQVWWMWYLGLDPTWLWQDPGLSPPGVGQGLLGCMVCVWIWGSQLDPSGRTPLHSHS